MIIIKDIEVFKVDDNRKEAFLFHGKHYRSVDDKCPSQVVINPEIIEGRNYYLNENGEKVFISIGIRKDVLRFLGLPFDEFNKLQEKIDCLNKTLIEKDNFIAKIMNLNFWQRLMFVLNCKI